MKRRAGAHVAGLAAALGTMTLSAHAWAWGHTGHVQISRLAVQHLPDELPAFVRRPGTAEKIGELGAEPDLSKTTGIVTGVGAGGRINTAGTAHDQERDPGHYIDIDDQGYVLGGAVMLLISRKHT